MYKKSIILQIENETNDDLLETLKSISITPEHEPDSRYDYIGIKSLKFASLMMKGTRSILSYWHERAFRGTLNEKLAVVFANSGYYIDNTSYRTEEIDICTNNLRKENFDLFFKSFDSLFTERNGKNKLILAITAYKLIEKLRDEKFTDINENDIIQYKSQYPVLFGAGELLANYLSN